MGTSSPVFVQCLARMDVRLRIIISNCSCFVALVPMTAGGALWTLRWCSRLARCCFLALSIPLLAGRGAWLVAGYNTMAANQRERYDERKLCRATGCMLFGVSIACGLMACAAVFETERVGACEVADWLYLLAAVVLIADVIVGMWYARTRCYRT